MIWLASKIYAVGTVGVNNCGTPMKVIAHHKYNDLDIQFLDKHGFIKKHVTCTAFRNGTVKNPYDITVSGVGYIGVGKHKVSVNCKNTTVYRTWHMMLERCYGEKSKDFFQSYFDRCTVCEEWLCFQNFAEWYENNKYECRGRLHVDKDILYPGNSVYCTEKCILTPQYINAMFKNKQNSTGLPNGILVSDGGRYSADYNNNHLGTFDTLDEAFSVYANYREKHIQQVSTQNKDIIPDRLYQALMNYKVKIENDKNYKLETENN